VASFYCKKNGLSTRNAQKSSFFVLTAQNQKRILTSERKEANKMTVGERVKEVRKENGLSQEEFAHKLGFDTRGAIANIELERTEASDKLLSLISNLFGVREEWLRTGEGEMMAADTQSDKIAAFLGDLTRDDDDNFRKRFVEMLADLSPADWKLLEHMAEKLTQKKEHP
jgi:transcriptional regulator with XRE-family HTH domain